jgi:hypothetical protein
MEKVSSKLWFTFSLSVVLMQEDYKDLRACIYRDEQELARFRKLLVNCVLATDLFDRDLKNFRDTRWSKVFARKAQTGEAERPPVYITEGNAKATIILELIVQTSNIAHTLQHFQVFRKWNFRLFCEMRSAYQEGRSQEDPHKSWYDNELSFFDNHVIPLAKKLKDCEVFGVLATECVNNAIENRNEFAEFGQDIVAEYLQEYEAKQSRGQSKEMDGEEIKATSEAVSTLRTSSGEDSFVDHDSFADSAAPLDGSSQNFEASNKSLRAGESTNSLNLSRVFQE